jgi:DNA-binding FadR family transcriptional regulator
MELKPVERSTAAGGAFEQLFEGLLAGRLRPGEALPAERALTEALSVNRQAVREALQRLAQAGLVDIKQGGSTRVLDYRQSASLDLLPHLLLRPDGSPDPQVARSIMEMRASLGPDVARLAATRATSEHVTRLTAVVETIEEAGDDLELLAPLDLTFWDHLIDAADNIAYRLAFNSLRRTYEPLQEALRWVLADELRDLAGHSAIAAAVKAGDGDGASGAARSLLAKGTASITNMVADIERTREERS